MGAVCVTYCVGGLSVCNSIAGAYAEKSPVVVITGSPGMRERIEQSAVAPPGARFSHAGRSVRRSLCVAGTELNDPHDGLSRDRPRAGGRGALPSGRAISNCRATWSSVVPDVPHTVRSTPSRPPAIRRPWPRRSPKRRGLHQRSRKPVIIAGVEIHRFGLQDDVLALAESSQIPSQPRCSARAW